MINRLRHQTTNGPLTVQPTAQVSHGSKPVGLWYSVGDEWAEWCEVERFHIGSHVYELDVDWQAVADEWDGIEIAPYQFGCRMRTETRWYYPWDVASGCLWRPEALRGARER